MEHGKNSTDKNDSFYVCGILVTDPNSLEVVTRLRPGINAQLYTVVHRSTYSKPGESPFFEKNVGGTHYGKRENWKNNNDWYDTNDPEARAAKLRLTLGNATIDGPLPKYEGHDITSLLLDKFTDKREFHLLIEMIEEVGIIPIKVAYLETKEGRDGPKHFYAILDYLVIKGSSILPIDKIDSFPVDGEDFHCTDTDIVEITQVPFPEYPDTFCATHKSPLNGYIRCLELAP